MNTISATTPLTYRDLTIVVPTFNEESNIGELLEKLLKLYPGINVIVADDMSTDRTSEIVNQFSSLGTESNVSLLRREGAQFRGITASVLDGFKQVKSRYAGVMDGDLQHPPEVIKSLAEELHNGADLVIAARIPYKENQGLHRIAMTKIATGIARLVLRMHGFSIQDPMSGFFIGKTDLIAAAAKQEQRFEPQGYKVLFDLLRTLNRDTTVRQTPYQFAFRPKGVSKLRPKHLLYFIRSLFR